VDIVDIDDLFDAIERGKVGAASVEPEPEPEPSAGDYGDYDVGDGDDYGDYDDTPETKPEVKRLRGSEKKTSARRSAKTPTSTDSETDASDALSDASALIADDDLYRFDTLPGVDETAVRMYVDGGREYFNDLYEKSADWVNAKYETAANTTQLWVDEYEESGRSKTRLKVDVFLDAADPYSLELVLGPIQNLLRMDLGPLAWTFHAHSNVGQNRGRRANCGGEIAGSAARVSCVANAAVQCSQDVFQNMTSGLGRFEKRAEEIAARRAQVKRAKAALGATKTKSSSFSENESETSDVLTSNRRLDDEARLVRAPHTSRARTSRGVLSVEVAGEEDYAATPSPSEDYVKQDTFVDLFEPDDDASSYDSGYDADDLDVSSYDVPSLPSLFSDGGEEGEERDEFANGGLSRFDDTTAPLNVFLTCLSTKLLEMESASAFAFGDANKERSLLDMPRAGVLSRHRSRLFVALKRERRLGGVDAEAQVAALGAGGAEARVRALVQPAAGHKARGVQQQGGHPALGLPPVPLVQDLVRRAGRVLRRRLRRVFRISARRVFHGAARAAGGVLRAAQEA
jgi:hypothetical protein